MFVCAEWSFPAWEWHGSCALKTSLADAPEWEAKAPGFDLSIGIETPLLYLHTQCKNALVAHDRHFVRGAFYLDVNGPWSLAQHHFCLCTLLQALLLFWRQLPSFDLPSCIFEHALLSGFCTRCVCETHRRSSASGKRPGRPAVKRS